MPSVGRSEIGKRLISHLHVFKTAGIAYADDDHLVLAYGRVAEQRALSGERCNLISSLALLITIAHHDHQPPQMD